MPIEPTLAELIREAMDYRLLDVHTAIPGKVVSYSAAAQTVSVDIELSRTLFTAQEDKVIEALPRLYDVPVLFMGGNGFYITYPIAAGDSCLLVFSERNPGQWHDSGQGGDPGDLETHGLSGAMAIVGLRTAPKAISDISATSIIIGKENGTQIEIGESAIKLGRSASEAAVLGNALKTYLDAHTHSGVTAGGDVTGPPSSPATSILSSLVKVG